MRLPSFVYAAQKLGKQCCLKWKKCFRPVLGFDFAAFFRCRHVFRTNLREGHTYVYWDGNRPNRKAYQCNIAHVDMFGGMLLPTHDESSTFARALFDLI